MLNENISIQNICMKMIQWKLVFVLSVFFGKPGLSTASVCALLKQHFLSDKTKTKTKNKNQVQRIKQKCQDLIIWILHD